MSVCPSILASGARTAGLIGTDEYLFDVPERWKNDGASCGPIGCAWHVPRAILQKVVQILRAPLQAKQKKNGFGSNLVGRLPTCGGFDPLGCRLWRPLHTCERHVTRDSTLLHFAPERLVQLGRERHGSTRKDDGKTSESIVSSLEGDGFESRQTNSGEERQIYDFDTRQCDMQCRNLVTEPISIQEPSWKIGVLPATRHPAGCSAS